MEKPLNRPWKFVAKDKGTLEILLYEQIGQDFWSGDGTTAKQFAEDLKAAGDVSKIHLRINSPGGDVFDGITIYNTLLSHPAKVTAQIDGLAASIASMIAMAADELTMAENAIFMIHNPWSIVKGDSSEMRKMAATMDTIRDSMVKSYQRHTKLDASAIAALMDAESWMGAEEAKAQGFVEQVAEAEKIAASFDLSKFKNVPKDLLAKFVAKKAPVTETKIAAQAQEKTMADEKTANVEVKPNDAAEIIALGKHFAVDVEEMVRQGLSVIDAKEAIANIVLARAKEQKVTSGFATPVVGQMSDKEKTDYSIVKAIRFLAGEDGADAGLERAISQEIGKRLKKSTAGMFIPTRIKAAGLDTKTGAAGGFGVATEVRDLIELLRNRSRLAQLGATFLSGLDSNVAFPVQLTASNGSWVSQNSGSDVADSDASFGQKTMSPKTYQASTSYSRQLLQQNSIDIESLVRNDLAIAHALAIDLAGINGSGLSNQPLGLLKTSGIGDVPIGATGGAPTYAFIVDLETAVANANADEAGMKFLTTPVMRGKLRKTEQFATTNGVPVWQQLGGSVGVGDVLGYQAYVSKQVPSTLVKSSSTDCHAIIFGYWPSVLIGEWGVIELVVDPYRLKKQGMIEVTSFQMIDVLLRQPAQLAAIQDARNV